MIDIKKLNEAIGSSGWMLEGTDIDTDGFNSRLTIRLYGARQKTKDPEAWREEYRNKQAAGVRFEMRCGMRWVGYVGTHFAGNKEEYREVPQEVEKDGGVMIQKAAREVLRQWQQSGLKFNISGVNPVGDLLFTNYDGSQYTIPEQPIPEGMSVETVEAMWRQGLRVEYKHNGKTWRDVALETEWNRGLFEYTEILQCLRIPAQPIPEMLLEVPQEVPGAEYARVQEYSVSPKIAAMGIEPQPVIPHAEERALWKAQRDAGTNEVWQWKCFNGTWIDIEFELRWIPDCKYRVKPMKLTARIARYGLHLGEIKAYDWEFTGTREEYRAECHKYGYVVISEIKEVVEKPKTVKYYFALYKSKQGDIRAVTSQNKAWIGALPDVRGYTIIGDIEEREIEA